MKILTVFLDANVLFSAAWKPKSKLLRLWRLKNVQLFTTPYAAEETGRNLETDGQINRLKRIMKKTRKVPTVISDDKPDDIVLPDKDIPIFLAVRDNALNILLTGDISHFGHYLGKTVEGVKILTPDDFLRQYANSHRKK